MFDVLFGPRRADPLETMKELHRHWEAMDQNRQWPMPQHTRWESKIEYRPVDERPAPSGDALRPEDV